MYKNYVLELEAYNICITHQFLEFESQLVSVPCGGFSLCAAIGRLLIDKIAWCICIRLRDYF